jgi:chaperone modulatory protein CbpM
MTPTFTMAETTGLILEEQTGLSLADLCRACEAEAERIMELVHEGGLAPAGAEPGEWRFSGLHLQRARVALRLQTDLDVNLAGAALALELLDELDELRARVQRLEAAGR